jgi:hypothetical protein
MDHVRGSAFRALRLVVGLSIVTAGGAIALTLLYLSMGRAPQRPATGIVATLGVGVAVLVTGRLMSPVNVSAQSGHDSHANGASPLPWVMSRSTGRNSASSPA